MNSIPIELLIKIAQCAGPKCDEYIFNALARALPRLGRWTIMNDSVISRKLDLMLMFGYSVMFAPHCERYYAIVWLKNGLIHSNDRPAVNYSDGDYIWKKHDMKHGGSPTSLIHDIQAWYHNGVLLHSTTLV